jgi:hypothetical protein
MHNTEIIDFTGIYVVVQINMFFIWSAVLYIVPVKRWIGLYKWDVHDIIHKAHFPIADFPFCLVFLTLYVYLVNLIQRWHY